MRKQFTNGDGLTSRTVAPNFVVSDHRQPIAGGEDHSEVDIHPRRVRPAREPEQQKAVDAGQPYRAPKPRHPSAAGTTASPKADADHLRAAQKKRPAKCVAASAPSKATDAMEGIERKPRQSVFASVASPKAATAGRPMVVQKDQYIAASAAAPYDDGDGHTSTDDTHEMVAAPSSPKAAAGHSATVQKDQPTSANEAAPYDDGDGHFTTANDGHAFSAMPSSPQASAEGQLNADTHLCGALPLAPIIAEIRSLHRDRVFAMETRKRADLALGAFLRRAMGWSRTLPKAESDRIKKTALGLIALGEKVFAEKMQEPKDSPEWDKLGEIIIASISSRDPFNAIEAARTKDMERLAKSLPVWAGFGESIKGFGARSLAVIVAEAGDLTMYDGPAKLWKRFGLAVIKGKRQGGLRKSATAEEWIEHGYSAKRRSYMFVIGDVLIKNKNDYRQVYLDRKEYERTEAAGRGLTVAPAAKIPAKRKDEFISDGHIHRRAQRYMEKRLLRHLWQAWRRTDPPEKSISALSAAHQSPQGDQQTITWAPPIPLVSAGTSSAQAERLANPTMTPTSTLRGALS